MRVLDGWTALPLCAAAFALLIIGLRARELLFRAALDGPAFARELQILLAAGQDQSALALAQRLRPAWAAELAARALPLRENPEELRFELEDRAAELGLAAQRGLLALRSLGRLELPLSLAVAIVEIGAAFDAGSADRNLLASHAIGRGLFAVSIGLAGSITCRAGYGVLVRAAKQRLAEVRGAREALSG